MLHKLSASSIKSDPQQNLFTFLGDNAYNEFTSANIITVKCGILSFRCVREFGRHGDI